MESLKPISNEYLKKKELYNAIFLNIVSIGVFFLSVKLGWFLVERSLRRIKNTEGAHWLTLPIFATPIAVYLILIFAAKLTNLFPSYIADLSTVGLVGGIIFKFNTHRDKSERIKLIVLTPNGKAIDVWLDSSNITVGEARKLIAEALSIAPPSRVCIESGRGNFVEDLSSPLFPYITPDDSNAVTEFFGFSAASCHIFLKEEEPTQQAAPEEERVKSQPYSLLPMLTHRDAKYGDQYCLTAKGSTDTALFYIQLVEKFVGATPTPVQGNTIRFVKWDQSVQGAQHTDAISEVGDREPTGSTPGKTKSNGLLSMNRIKRPGDGTHIKHGDIIQLECDGR